MSGCELCAIHPHNIGEDHSADCHEVKADMGECCRLCVTKMARNLDLILECWALTTIPPWPSAGGGDHRGKSTPLLGGDDWMDWRQGAAMMGALTSWCRDWAETFTLPLPRSADLTTMIGWLRVHLEQAAREHPALVEFHQEIAVIARRGAHVAGMGAYRGQAIDCPADDCGYTIRINTADIEAEVVCRVCETRWSVARLLTVASFADAWVDVETASRATKVPESTLRRWAKAGHVERKGGQFRLQSIRQRAEARSA